MSSGQELREALYIKQIRKRKRCFHELGEKVAILSKRQVRIIFCVKRTEVDARPIAIDALNAKVREVALR